MATTISAPEIAESVARAVGSVPREEFLVALGTASPASMALRSPRVISELVSALCLPPDSKVLLVSSESGYVAAVLGRLATKVVTVVPTAVVAEQTRRQFKSLGFENVEVVVGDGESGHAAEAPYDGILVSSREIRLLTQLRSQLADGAHLVTLAGPARVEHLLRVTRQGDDYQEEELESVRMAHVIGDLLVEAGLVSLEPVEQTARIACLTDRRIG